MGWPLQWPSIVDKKLYNDVPWRVLDDSPESLLHWNTKKEGGYTKKTTYAFTETTKMWANSKRYTRKTGGGRWKGEKGLEEIVVPTEHGTVFGSRRNFTFKVTDGGPNDGNSWVMKEYSLTKHPRNPNGERNCNIVLCKITKFPTRPRGHQLGIQLQPNLDLLTYPPRPPLPAPLYQFGTQLLPGLGFHTYAPPPLYQFWTQLPLSLDLPTYPPPPPYQFWTQLPPSLDLPTYPPPPTYQFWTQLPPSLDLPTYPPPPLYQFGTQLLPMLDYMDCEFGAPLLPPPLFPPMVDQPGTSASRGPKSLWEDLSEWAAEDLPRTSEELNKMLDFYETAGASSSTAPHITPINAELQDVMLRSNLTDTLNVLGVEDDFHYLAADQIGVPAELPGL